MQNSDINFNLKFSLIITELSYIYLLKFSISKLGNLYFVSNGNSIKMKYLKPHRNSQ